MGHLLSATAFCCEHQFRPGAIHMNCDLLLPTPILAQCCLHQFQPGPVHTNPGLVLSTPILTWCCPHQFWFGAVRINFGLMLSTPLLVSCCSQHFWPSAGHTNPNPVLSGRIKSGPVLLASIQARCSLHLAESGECTLATTSSTVEV